MVQAENINSSAKRFGIYEIKLIKNLAQYFFIKGYKVVPHAQLNIAWGRVLSDIDLLLLKDGTLTYVEVKSREDKLLKALVQIERIKDYIDYACVATNRLVSNWSFGAVGLILVHDNAVTVVKKPTRLRGRPNFSSIISLKKECLSRFVGNGSACRTYINKYDLAQYIYTMRKGECTRECLKEIVTCGNTCDSVCPISRFVKKD
jgi:hypothetical protein